MNGFLRLFEQRIRGIRLIELIGFVLVFGMIFWVCLSKAREGEDVKRMNDLDRQIAEQQDAVGSLKIKVAQLERPARLEALAVTYLGMKPVEPAHEASLENLSEISHTTSRPVQAPSASLTTPQAPAQDFISTTPQKQAPQASQGVAIAGSHP